MTEEEFRNGPNVTPLPLRSVWGDASLPDDEARLAYRQRRLNTVTDTITGLCATHDMILNRFNNQETAAEISGIDRDIVLDALPHFNDIIAAFARRAAEMRATILVGLKIGGTNRG